MDSPLLPSMARQPSNSRFEDNSDLLGELSIDGDESGTSRSQQDKQSQGRSTEPSSSAQPSGFAPAGRPSRPRFSLFARPPTENDDGPGDETMMAASYRPATEEQDGDDDSDEEVKRLDDDETIQGGRTKENDADRDDRLRATLFELRKMNEVFEGFLGALEGSKEHNERLAERTSQTSALLDQYISLLGQAEHTQRLVLNEQWHGMSDDVAHFQSIAEQQAAALEAERQRVQAEIQARETREREAAERMVRAKSGVESVRGRGRGLARGVGSVRGARGRVPSTTSGLPTPGLRKPSATTSRGTGVARGRA